jgi:NAD(P)H-dependent FMN reductase
LIQQADVVTQLIELDSVGLAADDEGTAIKDPALAELIDQSDGLVIVAPEYNHGYPGSLKRALDSHYTEYVHKPVGVVGVSAGPLGGARMIENLLPVLRAIGLVPIGRDATVAGVADAFDEDGGLRDSRTERRIDGMLVELRWMAATLRYGRETVSTQAEARRSGAECGQCGLPMNHHADVVDEQAGSATTRVHACSSCGKSAVERLKPE